MPTAFTEADIHTVDIFDEVYLAVTIPTPAPGFLLNLGDKPRVAGWQPTYGPPVTSVINLRQEYVLPPGWEWPDDPDLVAQREGIEVALIHKCGTPARIFQAGDDYDGGVLDEIEIAPGVWSSPDFPGVKEMVAEKKRTQFDNIISEIAQSISTQRGNTDSRDFL